MGRLKQYTVLCGYNNETDDTITENIIAASRELSATDLAINDA
jgi:hypothetical protein